VCQSRVERKAVSEDREDERMEDFAPIGVVKASD